MKGGVTDWMEDGWIAGDTIYLCMIVLCVCVCVRVCVCVCVCACICIYVELHSLKSVSNIIHVSSHNRIRMDLV